MHYLLTVLLVVCFYLEWHRYGKKKQDREIEEWLSKAKQREQARRGDWQEQKK